LGWVALAQTIPALLLTCSPSVYTQQQWNVVAAAVGEQHINRQRPCTVSNNGRRSVPKDLTSDLQLQPMPRRRPVCDSGLGLHTWG